jgi:hypothetical protein
MTPRRASPWHLTLALSLTLSVAAAVPLGSLSAPRSAYAETQPEVGTQEAGTGPAIYRIGRSRARSLAPLLRLGLDVAGTGRDGALHLILTPSQVEQVRSLGYDPVRIDATSRGVHGAATSPLTNPNLGAYHTVAETHAEMAAYVSAHPSIALLDTIGFSIEGRAIEAVKISDHVGTDESEPEVLVAGCHHARELMSVEIPLYLMRRLLDGYGADPLLTSLVDSREIWIVPIVNPDGHAYVENNSSGQSSGWWRKNRRVNGDGSIGVDLNRNYGFQWGYDNIGSSPTPASDVFRGTGPFSEPETAAMRDFMAGREFAVSASFHSYGELVLYPWGYAELDTPDHPVFRALGDSLALQNGYLAGNPKSGAIYLTNGEMDDWGYGETALKPRIYSFTFEVNTIDQGGFAPNDALIVPTCELNWGPLLTLLRFADGPRRVVGPARPTAPTFVQVETGVELHWTYPAPDPQNVPARHDIRRVDAFSQGVDNAEGGVSAWDSLLFSWSSARHASGSRSFYSGAGDNRVSTLTAKTGIDAAAGDSLVAWAFWDLEADYDYWYAEASVDDGLTWTSLAGPWSSPFNPFGNNEGNGVTGTSGGIFRRAAFALGPFAGQEPRVRFRCVTDVAGHGEGLYLDDVTPVATESGVTITDSQSPTNVATVAPSPGAPTWFQIRAVDPEAQPGPWSPRARFDPAVSGVESPPPLFREDRLFPNAPNPFNPRTEIRFVVGAGRIGDYRLDIFDPSGRLVARLARGTDPGTGSVHTARWDGNDTAGRPARSGVYLAKLETVRGRIAHKIILLR